MITEYPLTVPIEDPSPRRKSMDSSCSEEDIAILRKWKQDFNSAATGHKWAYEIYRLMNNVCTSMTIGISACSGICTIVLTASMLDPTLILPIVSGASSIVVGSLLALGRSMDLEHKMFLHNEHSATFAELARDISKEHTLRHMGKSQYCDLSEFINIISDKIDRLSMHAPSLPGC